MSTDDFARHSVKLEQITYLVGVPRGQKDFKAPLLQLLNNGLEKGDMWGVVDVDPDLFLVCHVAVRIRELRSRMRCVIPDPRKARRPSPRPIFQTILV